MFIYMSQVTPADPVFTGLFQTVEPPRTEIDRTPPHGGDPKEPIGHLVHWRLIATPSPKDARKVYKPDSVIGSCLPETTIHLETQLPVLL